MRLLKKDFNLEWSNEGDPVDPVLVEDGDKDGVVVEGHHQWSEAGTSERGTFITDFLFSL